MPRYLLLTALALIGCHRGDDQCSSVPKAPRIQACVVPVGSVPTNATVSATGTVAAVSSGPVANGCMAVDATAGSEQVVLSITPDQGGDALDVEYLMPSGSVTWAVGDVVQIEYAQTLAGWGPPSFSLSLTRAGVVEIWLGAAGEVRGLSGAPLSLERGAPVCGGKEQCGAWEYYDLDVVGAAGRMVVPYGATRSVSDFDVTHGGIELQTDANTQCMDWFVASARAALARRH